MPEIWGWFNSQGGLAVALLCITDMKLCHSFVAAENRCMCGCMHTYECPLCGVLECEFVLVCMHMSTGV